MGGGLFLSPRPERRLPFGKRAASAFQTGVKLVSAGRMRKGQSGARRYSARRCMSLSCAPVVIWRWAGFGGRVSAGGFRRAGFGGRREVRRAVRREDRRAVRRKDRRAVRRKDRRAVSAGGGKIGGRVSSTPFCPAGGGFGGRWEDRRAGFVNSILSGGGRFRRAGFVNSILSGGKRFRRWVTNTTHKTPASTTRAGPCTRLPLAR